MSTDQYTSKLNSFAYVCKSLPILSKSKSPAELSEIVEKKVLTNEDDAKYSIARLHSTLCDLTFAIFNTCKRGDDNYVYYELGMELIIGANDKLYDIAKKETALTIR